MKSNNEIKKKKVPENPRFEPLSSDVQLLMQYVEPPDYSSILQQLKMMIYEGVVNETERADFSRNKLFNLFQGSVQN